MDTLKISIIFLCAGFLAAEMTTLGHGQVCEEKSCRCLADGNVESKTCTTGQSCLQRPGQNQCVDTLKNMATCLDPLGCPCGSGDSTQSVAPAYCSQNDRCIVLGGQGVCVSAILGPNQECRHKECFCVHTNPDQLTEESRPKQLYCSQGEWCVVDEWKPQCAASLIREFEVATNDLTFCRHSQTDSPDSSAVPCKKGATCIPFFQSVECRYQFVKPGEQCNFSPDLGCICQASVRTISPSFREFAYGQFCVHVPQTNEYKWVSKKIAPGEICRDAGCLCALESKPSLGHIYVEQSEGCFEIDGHLVSAIMRIGHKKVCSPSSDSKHCLCSVDTNPGGPFKVCRPNEICLHTQNGPACEVAESLTAGVCDSPVCKCQLLPGSPALCTKGEYCTSFGFKAFCFPDWFKPDEQPPSRSEYLCARNEDELDRGKVVVCTQRSPCRWDSTNDWPACAQGIVQMGVVSQEYSSFLCVADNWMDTHKRQTLRCQQPSSVACGVLNGKLACASQVISEFELCQAMTGGCLCRADKEIPSLDSAPVCSYNQICLRNAEGELGCGKNVLLKNGELCESDSCFCMAFDTKFMSEPRNKPSICRANQRCLVTYGEPICAYDLTGVSPQLPYREYPNRFNDGTACAYVKLNFGVEEVLTRRCPPRTICKLLKGGLDCQDLETKNVITQGMTCTNRLSGCFCQKERADTTDRADCKAAERCQLIDGEPECTYPPNTLFLCPAGMNCDCGVLAVRDMTIDQYCELGTFNFYTTKLPEKPNLFTSKEIEQRVDEQMLAGDYWYEAGTNRVTASNQKAVPNPSTFKLVV